MGAREDGLVGQEAIGGGDRQSLAVKREDPGGFLLALFFFSLLSPAETGPLFRLERQSHGRAGVTAVVANLRHLLVAAPLGLSEADAKEARVVQREADSITSFASSLAKAVVAEQIFRHAIFFFAAAAAAAATAAGPLLPPVAQTLRRPEALE